MARGSRHSALVLVIVLHRAGLGGAPPPGRAGWWPGLGLVTASAPSAERTGGGLGALTVTWGRASAGHHRGDRGRRGRRQRARGAHPAGARGLDRGAACRPGPARGAAHRGGALAGRPPCRLCPARRGADRHAPARPRPAARRPALARRPLGGTQGRGVQARRGRLRRAGPRRALRPARWCARAGQPVVTGRPVVAAGRGGRVPAGAGGGRARRRARPRPLGAAGAAAAATAALPAAGIGRCPGRPHRSGGDTRGCFARHQHGQLQGGEQRARPRCRGRACCCC